MRAEIDAVAFDIDGTLYPDFSLYWRMIPFFLANYRFMTAFARVRKDIRLWQQANPGQKQQDFFLWQASLMVEELGEGDPQTLRDSIHRVLYEGWRPVFERIKPFHHVAECFDAFRNNGLKIGILSDFLPSQKGSVWNLAARCDVVLGSEETGALKPSPVPFLALADALGVPPDRILYVGNSVSSDVRGASAVGMKTACIMNPVMRMAGCTVPGADISFSSYRKLVRNVLK